MPTYDYKCKKCEHTFEVFHGINDSPELKCPVCGEKTEKMIGAGIGLIFKGTGFYETDYKRKSYDNGKKPRNGKNIKKEPENKTEPVSTENKKETKKETKKEA